MLLKTISALTAVVLLATSATATASPAPGSAALWSFVRPHKDITEAPPKKAVPWSLVTEAPPKKAVPWSLVTEAPPKKALPWRLHDKVTTKRGSSVPKKFGVLSVKNNPNTENGDFASCELPPTPGNITNGGGRILKGNVNIYHIFYGKWSTSQMSILNDFSKHIGGSDYAKIEKTYGASGHMTYVKSIVDHYSLGKDLSMDGAPQVVVNTLKKKLLPYDTNAVYFLFTSPDVSEGDGGFCGEYCGYHYFAPVKGKNITFAFVGNPANCLAGCGPCNPKKSPNGDLGVDAMASVVAHELMEAVSDPEGNAWRDGIGYENADKCAWSYGADVNQTHGAYYNMVLGKRKFLIQQNWDAKIQGCAMSR